MTTQARIGHGSVFEIQTASSPPTWTKIAEVISITPPALARDAVDATHTESEEGWREFLPGLKDAGEVSIELNFVPGSASTDLLLSQFNVNTPGNYRIKFPDSPQTTWEFKAFLTGFEPEAPSDDKMIVTATFKLTGKPAFMT